MKNVPVDLKTPDAVFSIPFLMEYSAGLVDLWTEIINKEINGNIDKAYVFFRKLFSFAVAFLKKEKRQNNTLSEFANSDNNDVKINELNNSFSNEEMENILNMFNKSDFIEKFILNNPQKIKKGKYCLVFFLKNKIFCLYDGLLCVLSIEDFNNLPVPDFC